MTDAIEFLEQIGQNARWHAPATELERELAASGIDPLVRDALLTDDMVRLEELLGAQPTLCCLIVKPDPAQPDEEEEEDDEEDETLG